MQAYGVRDVEKLLGLPRRTIRALVDAGFVTPARGARNAWTFSFQDLIVLRTARTLVEAKVPHRRIVQAMAALRRRLPASMPLSGLSIAALGDRVVVREGASRWQADTGQYVFSFEGDPAVGRIAVVERVAVPDVAPAAEADAAFERGVAHERRGEIEAARRAYEMAIVADPEHLDARINVGRLLHEAGKLVAAERAYRDALAMCGDDALTWFNLGVVLEDQRRPREAIGAYEAALKLDASLADAHYNLALLHETAGHAQDAIRHLAHYRRLLKKGDTS